MYLKCEISNPIIVLSFINNNNNYNIREIYKVFKFGFFNCVWTMERKKRRPSELLFPYKIYLIARYLSRNICSSSTHGKMETDLFWFIAFFTAVPNYPFVVGETHIYNTDDLYILQCVVCHNGNTARITKGSNTNKKHASEILLGPQINRKDMILNNNKYCCQLELEKGCVHISIHPQNDYQYQIIVMNELYFGRLKVSMMKKKHKQNLIGLKENDKVRLFKNGKTGTVKYIGNLMRTTMIGLSLDEPDSKARDGKFCGKEYFKVEKGRGLFVRQQDIESKLNDDYDPYISGDKFALELDLKNYYLLIQDPNGQNTTRWRIDLQQDLDDLQNVRISLFLEERIGDTINLINESWQKL